MADKNIVLVLLAAGDSRRFHGNKLLTEVEGKPLYRHLVDELASLPEDLFYRKLVVSQYPEILAQLQREGYEPVENRESHLGISHSIGLALRRMDGREDAVCFAVCDQPYLKGTTVGRLAEGWKESGRGMACVHAAGRDGNPTIFSRKYEPALLGLSGDVGGRQVMKRFPEDVFRLKVDQELELEDIDRREDICYNKHQKL